jgi:hypothetical protein
MDSTNEWKLPWQGGCRCGRVRIEVSAPPLLAMACHCTGCQRMSSSAFSLSLAIPSAGFRVVSGEPVVGGLHGPSQHMFCGHCMTWMFTRPEATDAIVNLRPSMLDDHAWVAPYAETYTDEKLPWASTPAVKSYARFPEMSEYEGLTRDYARQGARPR